MTGRWWARTLAAALVGGVSIVALPTAGVVQASQEVDVRVVVDLSEQQLFVLDRAGRVIRTFEVSTGAPATPTPKGVFRVWRKRRHSFSIPHPEVRMEYMVNFHGHYGIHAVPYRIVDGHKRPLRTPLGERGVSAGCVRMRTQDARWVYDHLSRGTQVVVTG